ncbi:MAG: glutamate--cysteine ligase [Hyphomicrobiales bacterium]|nr:glutamate--cysteine ligase [Hyphomicrobiales bacterium]
MPQREDAAPVIESRDELVAYLEAGSKPPSAWRIGVEHEKFGFYQDGFRPVPYEGEIGIRALLEKFATRFGWHAVYEGENIIALNDPSCAQGGSITLEPGGQFELSGAPLNDLHETCAEVGRHLEQVREVANPMGMQFLGLGFSPKWTLAETPHMPKGRYKIMANYMPKVGSRGLDMMFRSCTVQVNLDFSSEADMVKKLRVSLALQPIAAAIFANSPFTEGRPNGFQSFRSEVWKDVDNARAGMLPFAFEDGMGFERYVDYALDAPMYFICRDGRYIDATSGTFRDFMDARHPARPGGRPAIDDWASHLTTLFPEVRLKRFLEMRGADGGPWRRLCALPAFWTGILYDAASLEAAWSLVRDWTDEERQALRDAVPTHGLKTPFRGGAILETAREAVAIARQGLKARTRRGAFGDDETTFIETVEETVQSGLTPAEDLLERYQGIWRGDINQVFLDNAY